MNGVAPLTYEAITAWARLKDVRVLPHEVDALLSLDAVKLNPRKEEE